MVLFKSIKRRRLGKEGLAVPSTRLKLSDNVFYHMDKSKIINVFVFVLLCFFCALVLILPYSNDNLFYLVTDQLAPKTVYAKLDFKYLNTVATLKKREQAKSLVPLIYKTDDASSEDIVVQLGNALVEISKNNGHAAITALVTKYNIAEDSFPVISRVKGDKKKPELLENKLLNIVYSGVIDRNEIINVDNPGGLEARIIDKNGHIRASQLISIIPTPEEEAEEFAESVSQDYPLKNRSILKEASYEIALSLIKPNLTQDKALAELEKQAVSYSEKNDVYE